MRKQPFRYDFWILAMLVVILAWIVCLRACAIDDTVPAPVTTEPEPIETIAPKEEAVTFEPVSNPAVWAGDQDGDIECVEDPQQEDEPEVPFNPRYVSIVDQFTEENIKLIAAIATCESRGEPYEGKRAVVEVILNRVINKNFGSTVKEVLLNPSQFSSCYQWYAGFQPDEDILEIVYEVIGAQECLIPEAVVYFAQRPENNRCWGKIGAHYFCYDYWYEGEIEQYEN